MVGVLLQELLGAFYAIRDILLSSSWCIGGGQAAATCVAGRGIAVRVEYSYILPDALDLASGWWVGIDHETASSAGSRRRNGLARLDRHHMCWHGRRRVNGGAGQKLLLVLQIGLHLLQKGLLGRQLSLLRSKLFFLQLHGLFTGCDGLISSNDLGLLLSVLLVLLLHGQRHLKLLHLPVNAVHVLHKRGDLNAHNILNARPLGEVYGHQFLDCFPQVIGVFVGDASHTAAVDLDHQILRSLGIMMRGLQGCQLIQ